MTTNLVRDASARQTATTVITVVTDPCLQLTMRVIGLFALRGLEPLKLECRCDAGTYQLRVELVALPPGLPQLLARLQAIVGVHVVRDCKVRD